MVPRPSLLLPCALLTCALLGTAGAQTLLPLDSRPATRVLPALIAGLSGGTPAVPPADLLGNAQRGADPAALAAWLNAQPASGPLIAALDALAYGGLVQSRTSPLSAGEALARLAPLRAWGQRTGQPIYAFITLPREPDATDRERNLEVVRAMIGWAREGVFRELHVTWDDALPGSPAPQEGATLAKDAPANVRVYPGADEVLSMLAARALSARERTLRVEYSDPQAAKAVIRYEGISLEQSAANHAQASGFRVVQRGPADLTLYVFNGGNPRWAAVQASSLLRAGPLAVADVEKVNLGNPRFWADLSTLRQTANLSALAAWGTPGNNLGSALAHAKLALDGVSPQRQDALLAREYANDVIYSASVRALLRRQLPESALGSPDAQAQLLQLAKEFFPLRIGNEYSLKGAFLPWGRSFEWDFNLQPK
ncbi:DUF4127 family protein [Deinococcus koreensis]|uniref:DUF4127 domain-containing protein n=1 Tax=Deinococcus koreensis TaxID=2054903 RepID=A0A2K3UZT6_9DEIO|nr:DUF4127 family protein [Deinococcus koreensis]PNY82047.1 hypothetical protein CVO96_12330 [Deinococcus koreensis]